MIRAYCTYFDHRYAARGIAMIRSLRRHAPDAQVWVLCMDSPAKELFEKLNEPGVQTISLSEFEREDSALRKAKSDGRTLMEYYFTCTASLVRYVMRKNPDAEFVTYLDGDLWFFASPEPIYTEAGRASTIIIPHRFPNSHSGHNRYGRYNVGWVGFRNSPDGIECLEWWKARTLEWCSDVVDEENDRFADQRYLDRFERLFSGVHSVEHPGANLAPWNIARFDITLSDKAKVDGKDLLFFHFHGLKRIGVQRYVTAHDAYGANLTPVMREAIYLPYLNELRSIEREIKPLIPAPSQQSIRRGEGGKNAVKNTLRNLRDRWRVTSMALRGMTIRVP
jgi:hypothetical protein